MGTLESFWDYVASNSGIVSLAGIGVSVALGCLALYYGSRYQRTTTTDLRAYHDQVLGQFAAVASLMGSEISELVAQDIGERATEGAASLPTLQTIVSSGRASERHESTPPGEKSLGNVNAVVAADVTRSGQKDLVVQNRDDRSTTLRVLAFDAEFQPRLVAVLSTDRRVRFATSDDVPAVVSTLEEIADDNAQLVKYRWTGQRLERESRREVSLSDPTIAKLLWP